MDALTCGGRGCVVVGRTRGARDKPVRSHLVKVYRTLGLGLGSASVGVYADFTGFTATYLPLFK